MRIISGSLKNRRIAAPPGHRTHPISEKMRGAIFSALGDIEGLTLFDPFAGSGAVSFEAISRGAASALAIDIDKKAHQTIEKNAAELGVADRVKAVRANASGWSDNNPEARFDLVILEPPYDDIRPELLVKLAVHTAVGGVLVVSLPPKLDVDFPDGFELLKTKSYGDSTLAFYRRIS